VVKQLERGLAFEHGVTFAGPLSTSAKTHAVPAASTIFGPCLRTDFVYVLAA